ncbi:MAG TPA: LPS assembly protein LptD [Nitrospirales bacterium]|nr:LPS assembly protein LptD [Nitrospirales bacterium]
MANAAAPVIASLLCLLIPLLFPSVAQSKGALAFKSAAGQPIEITADKTEFLEGPEVYEADGHVVVVQGPTRLTADHMTLMMLSGTLIATGRVHLTDPTADLRAGQLEFDVNTEGGVIVQGELFMRQSNTLVIGRMLQRFSENHYRIKEGSFTNCDAFPPEVPAWRFTFKDMDMNIGDGVYARDVWFCVLDKPILPLPTMSYPIQTQRKSGLLVPTTGYDNRFGFHFRGGYYWAIDPTQDLLVAPEIYTSRGSGGDVQYRYAIDKVSRGQWLMTYIHDTRVEKDRAQIQGYHFQQLQPDLTLRAQGMFMTDRAYLSDLSNSGVQRALPSADSYLHLNKRFMSGEAYFLGQFLQPVGIGGKDTFQRMPELGYRLTNVAPFGGPLLVGMDSTYVNWMREEGFSFNRVDVVPEVRTEMFSPGHVVGFIPRAKFRETYYTRNIDHTGDARRETAWLSMESTSRLSRRYGYGEEGSLLHTLEPHVIYEYVPQSRQQDIIKVDAVDDLPKKNLLTYWLNTRVLEQRKSGQTINWLNLTVAQSYRLGSTQVASRTFPGVGTPTVGSITQTLNGPTQIVDVNKFSDIWLRASTGNPVGVLRGVDQTFTVDTFFDPYKGELSQFNTDLRFQQARDWYIEFGERHTRQGSRPRRGDIWNPISFNEVYAPTPELDFLTFSAAFRMPLGWTLGGQTYYDIRNGTSPETDIVALWRNPCQCWSLGLYYIKFPDRVQYNFMISLTGVGATENFGTQVMKYILGPLVVGERGLPWPSPYGRRLSPQPEPPPFE